MLGFETALSILKEASTRLPQLRYAWGLLGVAAVAALIMSLLGGGRATISVVALTIVGTVIVFVATVAFKKENLARQPALVLIWSVTVFFVVFLGFTVTAVAASWPCNWAIFMGFADECKPPKPVLADCDRDCVDTALNAATATLANSQLPDGGFHSMGNTGPAGVWTGAKNLYVLVNVESYRERSARGMQWLLASQRPDGSWTRGGICRIESNCPGSVESTTWAVLALVEALEKLETTSETSAAWAEGAHRGAAWLVEQVNEDKGWTGFKDAETNGSRTYTTSMAVLALARYLDWSGARDKQRISDVTRGGVTFLHLTNRSGSRNWWAPQKGRPPCTGSTAHALTALHIAKSVGIDFKGRPSLDEMTQSWLEEWTNGEFEKTNCADAIVLRDARFQDQTQYDLDWKGWALALASLAGAKEIAGDLAFSAADEELKAPDMHPPWIVTVTAFGVLTYRDRLL